MSKSTKSTNPVPSKAHELETLYALGKITKEERDKGKTPTPETKEG